MHFRLRHVLNICFGFFEISQPSYFCFSGYHLNYIFNICFRKFNTSCWKKEHGKVSVTQPHLISCFEYIFKGTYQRYIPANRSASYLKVVDAIFKDLQSCSFPGPNRVRTEYGEILRISLRIQSECGKIRTWKTPNTDTFYAVTFSR